MASAEEVDSEETSLTCYWKATGSVQRANLRRLLEAAVPVETLGMWRGMVSIQE